MDILDIFKGISIVYTLIVIGYGWRRIVDLQARLLFVFMLLCFLLSAVLFFPEGAINDWLKHIPFYLGQLLFYVFLRRIIAIMVPVSPISPQPLHSTTLAASVMPVDWFTFLTDNGLQHIIPVPFLFLIVTYIRIQYSFIQSAYIKPILNIFMLAGFFLTMIHVGEIIVESLELMPILAGEPIEIIEFVWFYLAIGTYWYAVSLFPHKNENKQAYTAG